MKNNVEIYQSEEGRVSVRVLHELDTVWLTQRQMGELFATTPENVLMHMKNIYKEQELEERATAKKFLVVQTEGKRQVERNLQHYNLDAILSVGYRVNSKQSVQFRQWATNTLREHLLKGYSVDQHHFEQNAAVLRQALVLIEKTARAPELKAEAGSGLVSIVSRYTRTFSWLQQYDEGLLEEPEGQAGGKLPSPRDAMERLVELWSLPVCGFFAPKRSPAQRA
ncbi:virulence RhuM family protein [Granulosicoccus antarcticus]|uniref:Bro-N domain-containing protein n=1 Tax=Granulosicoccus antarcticus IMCC3135 TaxID=1192854 RepID=A0A2Z2P0D9_9GAMM|nr:hypothetical protein IMCC3135_28445 [Granulosicoccus antarcticus IMCC3135]